ncbi:hypothetical protein YC2023_060953 [Brassica napus]
MMHLTHSLISQIVSNGSRLYSCYINYNTQDQVEDILDKNDNFSEQLSVGSNHNKACKNIPSETHAPESSLKQGITEACVHFDIITSQKRYYRSMILTMTYQKKNDP